MKSKSYRGFTWKTNTELAILLNRSPRTMADWRRKHKASCEDYIDFVLNENRFKNNHIYTNHAYKGIEWNGTDKDLAEKLGIRGTVLSKAIITSRCEGCKKASKNPCSTSCPSYFTLREKVIDEIRRESD